MKRLNIPTKMPASLTRPGLTLPEMMVAVGITVIMMAAVGMIFKNTTKASGKALAYNTMMSELRTIKRQLHADFQGIRKDLPMVIIFESSDPTNSLDPDYPGPDNPNPAKRIRRDRICFFTSGKFSDIDSPFSCNTARVFYGQSRDAPPLPDSDNATLNEARRYLTRRYKLINGFEAGASPAVTLAYWLPTSPNNYDAVSTDYDEYPFEYAPDHYWKQLSVPDFFSLFMPVTQASSKSWVPIENAPLSFVRRPVLGNHKPEIAQKMLFLPDVTDFTVQIWHEGNKDDPYAYRWYPDGNDVLGETGDRQLIGYCCNMPVNITPYPNWRTFTTVPKAIKISFRLYDKQRKYFPEGRSFSFTISLD
ncbi:MAG: hypothetical protein K9M57_03935 [Phycisphaerae bacterium]|nr:hypothetical protein [Phycisphaerae bacterium]